MSDDENELGFTADSLQQTASANSQINDHAMDIIRMLNTKILENHEQGIRYLETTIPHTFPIAGMGKNDAQREIFYAILTNLLKRKFRIQITLQEKNAKVILAWFGSKDIARIEQQKAILQYYSLPFDKRTKDETEHIRSTIKELRGKKKRS
jgi:hypothetical protein